MGFRFRKIMGLLPGVKLNLSKSGASVSLGKRGATINLGPKGTRGTIGLPGTGLSYSAYEPNNPTAKRGHGGTVFIIVLLIIMVVLASGYFQN